MRTTSIAIAVVCLLEISSAFGQQSGTGTVGQMKDALLVPAGFRFEGRCGDDRLFTGKLLFSEQNGKLSVKIAGTAGSCESAVELTGDKMQFLGCGGYTNYVSLERENSTKPFKGNVQGNWCTYDMLPL
jgi:hypothetical protein